MQPVSPSVLSGDKGERKGKGCILKVLRSNQCFLSPDWMYTMISDFIKLFLMVLSINTVLKNRRMMSILNLRRD